MIKNKVFTRKSTDEFGNLELSFEFYGYLEDIDIDFGELETDAHIVFTTSNGKTFELKGNNSNVFPISPRTSINTKGMEHLSDANTPLQRYVNAGPFKVSIDSGGINKDLGYLEVIYEV